MLYQIAVDNPTDADLTQQFIASPVMAMLDLTQYAV